MDRSELCVELRLESDGIAITVEGSLSVDQENPTSEQAGQWFASVWSDAQSLLLHRTATSDSQTVHLTRSGWSAWKKRKGLTASQIAGEPPPRRSEEPALRLTVRESLSGLEELETLPGVSHGNH